MRTLYIMYWNLNHWDTPADSIQNTISIYSKPINVHIDILFQMSSQESEVAAICQMGKKGIDRTWDF